MICNLTTLCGRSFHVPDKIYQLQANALNEIKYKVLTSLETSYNSHSNSPSLSLHGTGKRSGESGSNWLFISVPMMELISKMCSGYQIISPVKKIVWSKHILGLVDDTTQYTNDQETDQMQIITNKLITSSQMWEQLLSTTGGQLEIPKCAVYTMQWNFDEQGIPYLDNNCKSTIIISSSETKTQQKIPNLYNHVPFQYLGVSSDQNGNQNVQFQESLNIAKKAARILCSTTFYHTQAKLYTNVYVNQNLYYPFPSVSFSSKQYTKINKAYIPQVIPSMEYNRMWPPELRYGCHDYGGTQIKHSEVESLIRKIKAIHNLLAKKDTKYIINLTIHWFQHASGSTYPCIETPPYLLNYVNSY